jgi:hypothetical protein
LVRDAKESQKIYERKRAFRLEKGGGLEGFQTSVHLRGQMGGMYSARDIRSFHSTITLQCREPKPACSQFRYHTQRRLHTFVSHAKQMVRFFFNYILFFICYFLQIYLTNNNFLLLAMVLGHKSNPMEVFMETHVRIDDC